MSALSIAIDTVFSDPNLSERAVVELKDGEIKEIFIAFKQQDKQLSHGHLNVSSQSGVGEILSSQAEGLEQGLKFNVNGQNYQIVKIVPQVDNPSVSDLSFSKC